MTADSPSLLLQRAADRLEELAASTTSGRWYVDQDSTGHIHADRPGCAPGYEPVVSDYTGECGVLNQADADWMVALCPAVSAALVAWLRYAQAQYEVAERRVRAAVVTVPLEVYMSEPDRAALDFACLVLGVSPEEEA